MTSRLVVKASAAAGQTGRDLHTMTILQGYQADQLKDLYQGEGLSPKSDLRTVYNHRSSCHQAGSPLPWPVYGIATILKTKRHLWLNLSGIKECDKAVLVDTPDLPSGLFGTAVEIEVDRFREVRTQSATFGKFIPRRVQAAPKQSVSSEPSRVRDEFLERRAEGEYYLPEQSQAGTGQHDVLGIDAT